MMFTFLVALNIGPTWAVNVARFEALLNKPIEERVREFKRQGQPGFEFLKQAAARRDLGMNLRWRAITTMGKIDPIRFRADLEKAMTGPDWFARNAALIAIRNDGRDQSVKWSTKLLGDPALVVRTQAVRNLIDLGARETEPLLWKMLFQKQNFRGGESLWVRAHLAEAVAKFADRSRVKEFRRLLQDEDERLHRWAIIGLENSTGLKITDNSEAIENRRQKWLSRLGGESI